MLAVKSAPGTAHGSWRLALSLFLLASAGTAASARTAPAVLSRQWWFGCVTKGLVTLEAMAKFLQHLSRSVMSSPKVVEEHPGAMHGMLFH